MDSAHALLDTGALAVLTGAAPFATLNDLSSAD